MHLCISKVTKNLDSFQYNVAVAALREFSNIFLSINKDKDLIKNSALYKALSNWIIMIGPLMPHLAEELWKKLDYPEESLVVDQKWPVYNSKYLEEEKINLVVQINGKKKKVKEIDKGLSKNDTRKFVLDNIKNQSFMENKKIKKNNCS